MESKRIVSKLVLYLLGIGGLISQKIPKHPFRIGIFLHRIGVE
ncbi:hypothetical protein [Bacillus thuringiensis]|nr:hypothetical protein [Bacillus thuringiensis]